MNFLFRKYAVLVVMFFLVSVVNNYALNFNIPMPLHMIFRSVNIRTKISSTQAMTELSLIFFVQGSLIASLILGMILLKRR